MNIHINLMDGLLKVRKEDFINIFLDKHKDVSRKLLNDELTAVNKKYGIILYHNEGFLFDWGELTHSSINWGRYISSFNMNYPAELITTGGNFTYIYKDIYTPKGQELHAIHPNIYRKYTNCKPYNGKNCMRICLDYEQPNYVIRFAKRGLIFSALQIVRNMLDNVTRGDAKWNGFKLRSCSICDEQITTQQGETVCSSCKKLTRTVSVQ